ncbi:MAG: hypothetical protein AAFP04_05545 [Myxococcota bacterium]
MEPTPELDPAELETRVDRDDASEYRDQRRARLALTGFGAVLLATMIASMHLSTLELSFGTMMFGSSQLWRGERAHFRLMAVDPQAALRPIAIDEASLTLKDKGRVLGPYRFEGSLPSLSLPIPDDLSDSVTARVSVATEFGIDTFEQTLTPVDTPTAMQGRITAHRELLEPRGRPALDAATTLRLYPSSGVFVDGLMNRVYGAAQVDGARAPIVVSSETSGFRAETDADGLFTVQMRPQPRPTGERFVLGEAPGFSQRFFLRTENRQLVASTEPAAFARPGETIQIAIETLPLREALFADLWIGDSLVAGTSIAPGPSPLRTELVIPTNARGLVRIDVFRRLLTPDASFSSATLWVSAASPSARHRELLDTLAKLPGDDWAIHAAKDTQNPEANPLAAMALSRFASERVGSLLLRNTVDERARALNERKQRLRGRVNLLFGATFALGIALSAAWALRHHLKIKRDVNAVVDEGLSAGEDLDEEAMRKLIAVQSRLDFVLVIAALIFAAYAILVLLTSIRWG